MNDFSAGDDDRADLALDRRRACLSPVHRELFDQLLQKERVSGHSLVARTLAGLGVTHVYGVAGQPVYDTFAACAREGIRLIGTHHQHPAALMAAAHNYFAGQQKAASIVSSGVPAASALSAVAVARDNCWPLVVLAGAAPQAAGDSGYFMALDGAELYRSVTKWAKRVPDTTAIPAYVTEAFHTAKTGRPGPVLVELPEDVLTGLAADFGTSRLTSASGDAAEPEPQLLDRVVAALIRARRPLLIVGTGVRWGSPFAELRELVEAMALPFITSPIGRGVIPDSHLFCMNALRWVPQTQADVVLLLGARLNWTFRYGRQIAPEATVIQVDVHAPEFNRSRKVDLGVQADAGRFVRSLLTEIGHARRGQARANRDHAWVDELSQLRETAQAKREAQALEEGSAISPLRLSREIREALPSEAISIFDSNLMMAACERMIPAQFPASRITPGASGCLGVGIPFAIAAKLVHPERPVVAICGDFAFGLSALELETAVRHNVAIVVVIANNDGNGGSLRQRMHMGNACREPIMMFQSGLRYDRICEVLGGVGEHVEHARDIGPALERAIASGRPACVNIAIDSGANFPFD